VAVEVVPAGKLTAMPAGSEGMKTGELAKAPSASQPMVLALLGEQESADWVRRDRRGERRLDGMQ
jgi:hypothetical protein